MAFIDISDEEAELIAESIRLADDENVINDNYVAFNLLQTFKKVFPHMEYMFDFLDYDFCRTDDDEDD